MNSIRQQRQTRFGALRYSESARDVQRYGHEQRWPAQTAYGNRDGRVVPKEDVADYGTAQQVRITVVRPIGEDDLSLRDRPCPLSSRGEARLVPGAQPVASPLD